MGKGKVAVKILLFHNLSEIKGPKRAGQGYDQMNIYILSLPGFSVKSI